MNEDLQQLLANRKLHTIAARCEEYLAAAEPEGTPAATLLTQLLRAEWEARQQAVLAARHKRARLPESWTLETFPFKLQTGVKERQIRTFAELAFIPKAENIIFIGETGVGKTGLMSGLVLKAVQNGYRALFIRAQDLFDEMYASLADRSTRKLLRSLATVDVLAIDELGYLNIKPEQTNIFFKLMEERYNQRATIITTNLGYSEWGNFLGNKALVDALLSRLRHQCHTVTIDGPSLRDPTG
jgi:DNA replication protein DnaC